MMACLLLYALYNKEEFVMHEKPSGTPEIMLDDSITYYSYGEILDKRTKYFMYVLFNTTMIFGYLIFDPDKRKNIYELDQAVFGGKKTK